MHAQSHRRLRRQLSGYADGELDAPAAEALAVHLLECDGCRRELATVRAIKGALWRLGEKEPPTLAAMRLRRWATSTRTMPDGQAPDLRKRGDRTVAGHPVRSRLTGRVGALAAVLAVIVGTGALLLHRQGATADPKTMTALVELARLDPPAAPAAPDGESAGERPGQPVQLGDHQVSLARYVVDGREVLVATSERAFPMPADARPVGTERDGPWLARRGEMGVACLSQPTHRLLVGPLPPERLVELGRELGPR